MNHLKYLDKRTRNNFAVRKCREKKKRQLEQLMEEIEALAKEQCTLEKICSNALARFHELQTLHDDACRMLGSTEDFMKQEPHPS